MKPWGTNHAVLMAKDVIKEPFCVINADDYYGVDAYRTMYSALRAIPAEGAAAMVGYMLRNTVTAHGTVSRGVCHVQDGCLTDIHETLKIALLQDGVIVIPKSTHAERMRENLDILDFSLTDSQMDCIRALDTETTLFLDHHDGEVVKKFMSWRNPV